MGITSIWHLLVILIIVLVVFGSGRLTKTMGDFGKGIRALRDGLKSEEEIAREKALEQQQRSPEQIAASRVEEKPPVG